MWRMRIFSYALVVLAGPIDAAAAQGASPDRQAMCRDGASRFAIGQRYSDQLGERAGRAARAAVVRRIEPGQAYTMEFRADRLNLETDRRGIVRRARCG
jgi:hypothetical protein